jgi:squalene-associated FAD-dependent desaturase
MPSVLVAGGGLAGLAAAAALGGAGFQVDLYESRGFLGGRATSFPVGPGDSNLIDNCQHVLLACFTNLLDLYRRLGVEDRIRFHREFYFVEPGGRVSIFRRGALPAPLHFTGAFLGLKFLSAADKIAVARGLAAIYGEHTRRKDLDRITMLDWLKEKRQTPRAIERFWRQVLVSAINEDLDRMAARHGFQVFWLGFLAGAKSYEMGLSTVPLTELYSTRNLGNVTVHLRAPVERISTDGALVNGETHTADYYVCALPFEKLSSVAPGPDLQAFEHSPITGIHLWFDRPVLDLPHATLLDRTIQWAFNKSDGRYIQVVVSASRSLLEMPRAEVITLAVRELAEFFPHVKQARLEKAHVIKEARATFSASPCVEALRPQARTAIPNLFLAGDWTRTGWPATMEGAVRSGYLAAEAVAEAAGHPVKFVR